ncbi:DNA-processing protein DprA [Flavobacterium sp.]|uniref:DNA-processing protein DprA n=1 Tax=Flavobacterium sp. TaxID=239 RepID=UPI0028BE0E95|nr:DNA-processing protein DprA [Flavobacterium sp.]
MTTTELFYTLALLQVEGVGDISAKKLITQLGSAENVFKTSRKELKSMYRFKDKLIERLSDESVFEKAEKELAFIQSQNIEAIFFKEPNYPGRLKHCSDGPTLLFQKGATNLQQHRTLSIVGTRNITNYGIDFTRNLIETLQPLNPVIVSGFAYGVDIVAHQAAMDCNLQTVGVLAHGLNQIYPKSHKKYCSKMEANGGFLTEFWSTSNPERENFVKRNRIVAGISEATIVIESAEKGGSLITANLANDYNREVFAVPGRTSDKYSQGCNLLIKTQRAHLLSSAEDLIYHLNWNINESEVKSVQKQLFVELEPEEQKVYDFLVQRGKEVLDLIAIECQLPVHKISTLLLQMELKGVIRPLPGKQFEAI